MKRKELKILGLSYSQTNAGSYICVLSEKKGHKKIPLIIKSVDAQRIALELEGIKSPRPLVHDVVKSICDSFDLDVQEVFIHALLEGVFYTKITISNGIEEVEIECMAGDALALSVIFKCPIYVTNEILETSGIIINDDGTIPEDQDELDIDGDELDIDGDEFDMFLDDGKNDRIISVEDLEKLMTNAIENEEYEIAASIRDRINEQKGDN
jgi:bifunctional DNase/RNase